MNAPAVTVSMERLARLPGWELITQGLADVGSGRLTPAACAIWIAAPRLLHAGLIGPDLQAHRVIDAELTLYRLLRAESANGYGSYNGIVRRLVRFEHALDREMFGAKSGKR